MKRIYLDNNATTFVDPKVIETVTNTLKEFPGNPSSSHTFGREAKSLLMKSREIVANYLNVQPKEIIFTSSGTEGINIVLKGILKDKPHIITSNVEHAAVYETLKVLQEQGLVDVTYLPSEKKGYISFDQVANAIQKNTKLIALMAVNNETGVKTDIASIANLAKENKIEFLVDAVALFGKEYFSIPEGVTYMAFSGHKFHAPKGSGFLYIKTSSKLTPLIIGGQQEYNRRAGTENLADIAGIAEAVKLLKEALPTATEKILKLRQKFEDNLINALKEKLAINGEGPRICNTVNIAFFDVDGEALLSNLDQQGIAVSLGSACSTGSLEPSRVLLNMGYERNRVLSSIRFSLSRYTTEEEIELATKTIIKMFLK